MTSRCAGRASIESVGFWSRGRGGWPDAFDAIVREPGAADSAGSPVAAVLGPTERRRASDSVALALDVAHQACRAAGRGPTELRSVFASMHGDLAITDYLCSTLAKDPLGLSPTRFHNSVHNAAAGYWTIGTGCREPYTAIAAGDCTAGEGLLEALAEVACEDRPVLFVACDTDARGPLVAVSPSTGRLGFALVLGPVVPDRASRRIDWDVVAGDRSRPRTPAGAALAGNAMSPVVPLAEAIAAPGPATVRLALSRTLALELRLSG
ncbi:MAG: beta-ketoacyl synthase chain length factor [Steroidobacteraceae bacterium]